SLEMRQQRSQRRVEHRVDDDHDAHEREQAAHGPRLLARRAPREEAAHVRRYEEVYRRSLEQPEEVWAEAAQAVDWDEPPARILDGSRAPFYRWFSGGRLSTAYNALDRHVERGRADQAALIYDSPVTGAKRTYSYAELRDEVALFAGALRACGVEC